MTRATFQVLSETRRQEAVALLSADHYPGAYYLAGYSVECALKACVAKQVKRFDFPDKKLANAAFTHDLEQLVKVAEFRRLPLMHQAAEYLVMGFLLRRNFFAYKAHRSGRGVVVGRDSCTNECEH